MHNIYNNHSDDIFPEIMVQNRKSTNIVLYAGKKVFKWATATRLRKALSIILITLITLTSIRYIFLKPKDVSADSTFMLNEGYGTATSVNDSNGNTTAGSVTGATWRTDDLCSDSKCLFFDGTQDYVSFSDDSDLDFTNSESFTVAGWFRHAPKTSGTDIIVSKMNSSDTDGGYQVQMESDGDITCEIDDDDADTTIDDSTTSTEATYDDNKWHYFSCVKSASTSLTLYIDAIQVAQDASIAASTTLANDDPFTLGIDGDLSSNDYTGFIDEVKVYRSAKTGAEIKADMTGTTPSRGTSASFGSDQSYISNGLVGYWKLDESSGNATDHSGNGSTLTNVSTTTYSGSKFGNGMEPDGSADYLQASDNAPLSVTGSLTLSAWINPDDTTGSQDIIAKWDGANESYLLAMEGANLRMYIDSASNYEATTGTPLTANTFQHVAGAYDSVTQTVKLYVNGSQVTSSTTGTIPASIGDDAGQFHLGAEDHNNTPSNFYDGHIDEARVYNRALSPAEVEKLYNWAPAPLAYWNLDENTGTTSAFDKSTNENTATLSSSGGGSGNITFTNLGASVTSGTNPDIRNTADQTSYVNTSWTPPTTGIIIVFVFTSIADPGNVPTISGNSLTWTQIATATNDPGQSNRITLFAADATGSTTGATTIDYSGQTQLITDALFFQAEGVDISGGIASAFVQTPSNSGNGTTGTVTLAAAGHADNRPIAGFVHKPTTGGDTTPDAAWTEIDDVWAGGPQHGFETQWDTDGFQNASATFATGDWLGMAAELKAELTGGGAAPSWSPGKFGSSLKFNGTSDYLSVSDTNALDITGDFTLSAWISEVNSSNGYIISKTNGTTDGGYAILIGSSGELYCRTNTGSANDDSISTSGLLSDNGGWHHVSVVKSGTSCKTYIDGVDRTSTSDTHTTVGTNANSLTIATRPNAGAEFFGGMIDDAKVYNYARTSAQIVEDMNAGHPAPGSPVGSAIGFWKFDEGADNTCSGGSNDTCNSGSTGTTLDGSQSGMASPATATSGWTSSGKFGKALSFDGSNDFIQVTDTAALDITGDFTLSAWVARAGGTNGTIISKVGAAGSGGYELLHGSSGEVYCRTDNGAAYTDSLTATGLLNADSVFHHVAIVRSGSSCRVYFDGQDKTSTAGTHTTVSANANNLRMGSDTAGTDLFNGKIDEPKVYNIALTASQIVAEMNRGSSTILGASSTETSGLGSFSSQREYCPPGNTQGNCGGSSNPAPVAEWKMEKGSGTTINDTSGNANTSSAFTGDVAWVPGQSGYGLYFDGADDVVRIVESSTTDFAGPSDSYSVSAWVKTTAAGTNRAVVFKLAGATTTAHPFRLSVSSELANFAIHDGTAGVASTSTINVADDKWHHLVGVRDTATDKIYIYVDGILYDSDTDPTTGSLANNDDISIGNGGASYNGNDFTGIIDNVRIYNYARTHAQIAWEFNRNKPHGWWKLDECTGTTINDSSGNGFSGTISAGAGTHTSAGTCNSGSASEMWDDGQTGKRNYSLDFDGNGDTVDMNSPTSAFANLDIIDDRDFSLAGWFNREAFAADHTIVGKRLGQSNADPGYLVWIDDSTDKLTMEVCDGISACDEYTIESTSTFTTTGWNHFVIVWDDDNESNTIIYINGQPETITRTGTFANVGDLTNPRDFRIGSESDVGNPFAGELDDIMIFGHVVSATQVKGIYNNTSAVFFGPDGAP